MSEQPKTPQGPDLTQGIPASDVREGAMVSGHVDGKPVLIARVGQEFLAITNKCTHYSAPLAKGLLVGDTVRCPWHHACFSLRTGEPLRAPALDPVDCWTVEQKNGTLRVTGKAPAGPRPRPASPVAAKTTSRNPTAPIATRR